MHKRTLCPENTVFVVLSFEGPDGYSLAGGLGVRVSRLCTALATQGFETHLFFIGDPDLEGTSSTCTGRFQHHRWCQWISRYHPNGVYDGEEGKRNDYTTSLPEHILQTIARPAITQGKFLVVLAEEWHTAETVCRLSDLLDADGLADSSLLLWNANNTYAFHRIDWRLLRTKAIITTVSRYMRHIMQPYGINPLVIPNGIQSELIQPVRPEARKAFQDELNADFMLFKMARFDPAKGWIQAMETAARLKAMGYRILFFLRGGIEPFGREVFALSQALGLSIRDVNLQGFGVDDSLRELVAAQGVDVINITSFIPHELSRIMFACSDAVLANSDHEPFGLVGLETMAAGGTAYVGMTGEDYAHDLENAVVLESSKAEEMLASMLYLHTRRDFEEQLRNRAQSTARNFTWDRIIEHKLLPKLERLDWELSVETEHLP